MKKGNWLGVCMALGLVTCATASTPGEAMDDSLTTAKVKTALVDNPDTKARQIDVETRNGVVQLNGFVDSASEKMSAESTASSIAGVKSVSNNLQIREAERTAGNVIDDSTITAKVKTALTADERTKAHQVEVKTYKGVVSLGGFVATPEEKQAAESLAEGVEGVAKVENGIMLGRGESERSLDSRELEPRDSGAREIQ